MFYCLTFVCWGCYCQIIEITAIVEISNSDLLYVCFSKTNKVVVGFLYLRVSLQQHGGCGLPS